MRLVVRIAAVLAAAALLVLGFVWLNRDEQVSVSVVAITTGRVEKTVANTRAGTLIACRRAQLSTQIGGRVARRPVEEGQVVEAGTVLLELWNEDLVARHDLASSETRVAISTQHEVCFGADLASREADRFERLFEQQVVGESAVDRARGERDRSRAACIAATARTEEAGARLAVAEAILAQSVLVAPFRGVIAELNVQVGEFVTPSPPGIPTIPAVDLIEEGCVYVFAPIDEIDAPLVSPGLEVRINLDSFPDRDFAGRVRRVAPYVLDREKQARTVDVEIEFSGEGPVARLLPGYSADVEILLASRSDALRIPTEAVFDEDRVLVLEDGRLVARRFEGGLSNWEYTEVVSGLDRGEFVVLSLDRDGVIDGAHAVAEEVVEQ